MRVIRARGSFGDRIEVAGQQPSREVQAVALARALDRPIGRGGGARDALPDNVLRDGNITVAVSRELKRWIMREAAQHGLAVAAFCGMIVEAACHLLPEQLDELLSGEQPPRHWRKRKWKRPPRHWRKRKWKLPPPYKQCPTCGTRRRRADGDGDHTKRHGTIFNSRPVAPPEDLVKLATET